jgi:hypothetical protein
VQRAAPRKNKQEESPRLKLPLDRQREELLANGQANLVHRNNGCPEQDLKPVVKPFRPCSGATWLLTELDLKARQLPEKLAASIPLGWGGRRWKSPFAINAPE